MLPANVRRLIKPVNAAKPAGQAHAPPTARQNIHPVRTAVTQVLRTGVRCTGHVMATVAEMEVFHLVIRGAAVRDALLQAAEEALVAPAVVLEGPGAAVLAAEVPRHPSVHGKSGASFLQIMDAPMVPIIAGLDKLLGCKQENYIVKIKILGKPSILENITEHIMLAINVMIL